jgi:hypothetical protein
MNRLMQSLAALLIFGAAGSAEAIQFKVTGDLNNRVNIYTDQATLYSGAETITANNVTPRQTVDLRSIDEFWAEIKYRLQAEASTDDSLVRGVYALEIGAIRFGSTVASPGANSGGGFSGDGVNVETRFAYVDFGFLPTHRISIGLLPWTVNRFLWNETATAVQLKGSGGPLTYTLGWARGLEAFNTAANQQLIRDADNFLLRGELSPIKDLKVGVFGLYQRATPQLAVTPAVGTTPGVNLPVRAHLLKRYSNIEYDLYNVGIDGGFKTGPLFANWDFIYQFGNTEPRLLGELDVSAFLAHIDLGVNLDPIKVTYTGWYASGDDDLTDGDQKNFTATDVDFFDSVVLFEGGFTDDSYFTEAPYFLDKGAIFNKLALDFKATDKLTLGLAGLYIMAAEDLNFGTPATTTNSKNLGIEIDAAVSYKLTKELELAVNAGYLIADDGMLAFQTGGALSGADPENIFRTTMRARYQF